VNRHKFEQAKHLVREYCVEEGLSVAKTRRIAKSVGDLRLMGNLDGGDRFVIWDALGLAMDRDHASEALYQFLGVTSFATVTVA
jgi:hypothetical protein